MIRSYFQAWLAAAWEVSLQRQTGWVDGAFARLDHETPTSCEQHSRVFRMVTTDLTANTPPPRPGPPPSASLTSFWPPRSPCPGVLTASAAPSPPPVAGPRPAPPPSSTGTRWGRLWTKRIWSSGWWTLASKPSSRASSSHWTWPTGRSAMGGSRNLEKTYFTGNFLPSSLEIR